MRTSACLSAILTASLTALFVPGSGADTPPGASPPQPAGASKPAPAAAPARDILEELRGQAAGARRLVKTDAAASFLNATSLLSMPRPEVRTVWRDKAKGIAISQAEYDGLAPEKREGLVKRDCDARFYYTTGYGTPLMYARPLDLFAERAGIKAWPGVKICDFGYGTIGHLRLLASLGANVTGVDVEPLFHALYSAPGDTGEIPAGQPGSDGVIPMGRITLVNGRWPAEEGIKQGVGAGFDVFISKNTLKRGYIHPARKVDERFLVKLGVEDEAFVKAVHDALKPGGWFMIYNLSPKQAPEDKPYLPHADGECPFPREMLEKAGFEVLEYDREDRTAAVDWWLALGIAEGKSKEEVREDLFAWWMLARKRS